MNKALYIALFPLIFFPSAVLSGPRQCPAALTGYLKPIAGTGFSAAAEAMISGGMMSDGLIGDAALYLGTEYSTGNHLFYAEGGFKGWGKKYIDKFNNTETGNAFPGMRELFWQYQFGDNYISTGMQTSALNDFLVLDERAFSVNAGGDIGKFSYSVSTGSVNIFSARNGKFCSKEYLYALYPERKRPYLGRAIGETAYAGFSVYFDFEKENSSSTDDDEFSEFESTDDDEFSEFESTDDGEFSEFESTDDGEFSEFESTDDGEFSEFESTDDRKETVPLFTKKKFGVIIFDEFGSSIDTNRFFGGIFLELGFPLGTTFKHEVLYQEIPGNHAIIVLLHLDKTLFWGNRQRTIFSGDYYHTVDIDRDASIGLSYANIFAGTVMRMDAIDMPLYSVRVKHSFMKYRFSIMSEYNSQIGGDKMRELDIRFTKRIGKNFKLGGVLGAFDSDYLSNINFIGQIEFRANFSFSDLEKIKWNPEEIF